MKFNLKEVLVKHTRKTIHPHIEKEIVDNLKVAFEFYEYLTEEDVKAMLAYQDEEGTFKITKDGVFDGEVTMHLWYDSTYLITCTLLRLYLTERFNIDRSVIITALNACEESKFAGHGYNGYARTLQTTIMFLESGICSFLSDNFHQCEKFSFMILSICNDALNMLKENEVIIGWGCDVSVELHKIKKFKESIDKLLLSI